LRKFKTNVPICSAISEKKFEIKPGRCSQESEVKN